jgi:hypothetical protein
VLIDLLLLLLLLLLSTSFVRQGPVLEPFRLKVFINDPCSSINLYNVLIFADLKILQLINSPHD